MRLNALAREVNPAEWMPSSLVTRMRGRESDIKKAARRLFIKCEIAVMSAEFLIFSAPQHSLQRGCELVGASRFERPTTRTPSEYATGLRHAPTSLIFLCGDNHCRLATFSI